ncbi:MAG: hypothetical protein ACTSRI_06390 [Promethearchaeota archaeon]
MQKKKLDSDYSEKLKKKKKEIFERTYRDFFAKHAEKTYNGLFKGIEITKSQFFTLYLISLCISLILIIDIFLSFEIRDNSFNLTFNIFIIIGVLLGLISGGFLNDRIKGKRYQLLFLLIIVSGLITISHLGFFYQTGVIIPSILFMGDSFIAGLLFILFLAFYIDFTTVLDRGRVFSFLIIMLSISIGIIILLISMNFFFFVSILIFAFSFYYFYKNQEKKEYYKSVKKEGTKIEIKLDIIKSIILLSFFSLTIGLMFPIDEIFSQDYFIFKEIILITALVVGVIFTLGTALIVGVIFDFSGRKALFSNIIFAISIVNFIRLFDVNKIEFLSIAIIIIALLANFMSIPLLMTEIALKDHLGRIFGLTYFINIICVILGIYIKFIITQASGDELIAGMFLIGVINFVSIICLFFLVNSKEMISSKEQNWSDNLIHLYAIHDSGMLLYEYSFTDLKEELAESELVSGGFIGLISMLQEITKETSKSPLRSIDHGGKKILFGFTTEKKIIIALLITEDLLVLRRKISDFIQDIEKLYSEEIHDLNYINKELWFDRFEPILTKHFKPKYFALAPEKTILNKKKN